MKVCGCYLVCLSCSPTFTNYIYKTKIVLHYQLYDETYAETKGNHTSPVVFTIECRVIISI